MVLLLFKVKSRQTVESSLLKQQYCFRFPNVAECSVQLSWYHCTGMFFQDNEDMKNLWDVWMSAPCKWLDWRRQNNQKQHAPPSLHYPAEPCAYLAFNPLHRWWDALCGLIKSWGTSSTAPSRVHLFTNNPACEQGGRGRARGEPFKVSVLLRVFGGTLERGSRACFMQSERQRVGRETSVWLLPRNAGCLRWQRVS